MKLIRLPDVQDRVCLGRTTLYKLIKDGKFPAPIKQGTASFWIEAEIEGYLQALIAARPASQPISAS